MRFYRDADFHDADGDLIATGADLYAGMPHPYFSRRPSAGSDVARELVLADATASTATGLSSPVVVGASLTSEGPRPVKTRAS